MRIRWLALGAGLALVLAVLTRGAAPPPADTGGSRPARAGQGASPTEDEESELLPPPPARDIFRYAEPAPRPRTAAVAAARPRTAIEAPEPGPVPMPPPVRLVGLVRRAEGLRAAVATAAGVAVVGPGDVFEGFTVVSLDEDRGLRLRAADGREIVLQPGG